MRTETPAACGDVNKRISGPSSRGSEQLTLPTDSDPPSPPAPVVVNWALGGPVGVFGVGVGVAVVAGLVLPPQAAPVRTTKKIAAAQILVAPFPNQTIATTLARNGRRMVGEAKTVTKERGGRLCQTASHQE